MANKQIYSNAVQTAVKIEEELKDLVCYDKGRRLNFTQVVNSLIVKDLLSRGILKGKKAVHYKDLYNL